MSMNFIIFSTYATRRDRWICEMWMIWFFHICHTPKWYLTKCDHRVKCLACCELWPSQHNLLLYTKVNILRSSHQYGWWWWVTHAIADDYFVLWKSSGLSDLKLYQQYLQKFSVLNQLYTVGAMARIGYCCIAILNPLADHEMQNI